MGNEFNWVFGGDLGYDPFGSVLEGRNWEVGSEYRYGFNGKEQDIETYGNEVELDFGSRVYNCQLGRFYSIDPHTSFYSSQTPYSFAGNSPILLIDKNGEFPWLTGAIGAGVNILIGYTSARLNHEEYTLKDAMIDGAVGFAIGSGVALVTGVLGISTAATVGGRIIQGTITGTATGFASNALDQGIRISTGDQEGWNNSEFIASGIGGVFGGAATAGMSKLAQKFFTKMGDKALKNFTESELKTYVKYQTKFLKQRLEEETGKKVGKRQLQSEVEKVTENWKNLKISEIDAVKYTVTTVTDAKSEVVVSLATIEASQNILKEDE